MVGEKRTTFLSPTRRTSTIGELEKASTSRLTVSVTSKTALRSGSSQHGKARLASTDSNCVVAMVCVPPASSVNVER
jgi:hypothetical protein